METYKMYAKKAKKNAAKSIAPVFFFPTGNFFFGFPPPPIFFRFPTRKYNFFPTTSANWWEMVGKRIFWWEKVVVPRGYIQNFPPIFPPFPSGKKKHWNWLLNGPARITSPGMYSKYRFEPVVIRSVYIYTWIGLIIQLYRVISQLHILVRVALRL